ncbi:hypothetical protein DWV76_15330 [Segatella copri]|uniref:Uncharacterized protein n=1 Tax=Segatella copri TaxID=165179 RepID=A0AA93BEF5_9BACT|nr:hypothetical protein DWV76_15330 [Segatella copri]
MPVRQLHNLLTVSDLYHAGQICPDKFNLSVFFFLERGELYSLHSYWVFSYLFHSHISLDGAKLRIKYQIQKIKRQKKERRASQPASPERFIENATHGIPILLIKNIILLKYSINSDYSP